MAGQSKLSAHREDIPPEVRGAVVARCMALSENGAFWRGAIPMVAAEYGIHCSTVYRIYNRAVKQLEYGYLNLCTRRHFCGRKALHDQRALQASLRRVPFSLRTSIADAANALDIPVSSFRYSLVRQGFAVRHSNHIKPHLSDVNKEARVNWVLQFIHSNVDGTMSLMYDMVHIDEKWFDLSNKVNHYYVDPKEVTPHRTITNGNRIPKVMFLTAVARPRFDLTTGRMFDGKIGCWAFVVYEPAQRNSKNRPKGTLCPKAIAVTRDVSRTFLVEKVIPAIKKKWPRSYFDGPRDRKRPIFIQQDNARAHVLEADPLIVEAGTAGGWQIHVKNQPANSPDLNVLDLGLFNAISKMQARVVKNDTDDLIAAVYAAFNELPFFKINHCFLTLQRLMSEIIVSGGGNDYFLPHMRKHALIKAKRLPERMRLTAFAMETLHIGPKAADDTERDTAGEISTDESEAE